jgi:hypothetical protein
MPPYNAIQNLTYLKPKRGSLSGALFMIGIQTMSFNSFTRIQHGAQIGLL